MHHITLHQVMDVIVYWGAFWNAIYFLAPPREFFNSPKYNKFLDLVSYYGALNIRGIVMKFYGAQPSEAPPPPKHEDTPPAPPATKEK
jgi:hypothetical protein